MVWRSRRRTLLQVAVGAYIFLVILSVFNFCSRCQFEIISISSDPVFAASYNIDRCSLDTDKLGLVDIDMGASPSLAELEAKITHVRRGGHWSPSDCKAYQKVAIIVPYRNRWSHLLLLMDRLHNMLYRQSIDYRIFVVEQFGDEEFNRGRLLNIGAVEALKVDHFDCFVFHDVDLLPKNDKNLYYCNRHVRHLASAINEARYHVMYYNYAGGVVALKRENFFKINGFSNDYWGWGSEDDDFSARTMASNLLLSRPPEMIGRYKMARHVKQWRGNNGYEFFMTWRSRWKTDGINSVATKYRIVRLENQALYTNITVNIGQAPEPPSFNNIPKETWFWFLKFFFP